MQIPVQQFPILTAGQMSPFHQALQTGLENYQNMTKAAYTPMQMQADIASKAAYATYSPYSYLSKAISDPLVLAALAKNPDQLNAVMSRLASMPTNPMDALNKGFGSQGGGGIGGLWDNLKSELGIGGASGANGAPAANQSFAPQGAPQSGTGADSGYSYDKNGNNIQASPQEITNIANRGNNAGSGAVAPPQSSSGNQGDALFNSVLASKFPYSEQGITQKTNLVRQEANARVTAEQQGRALQKLNDEATASTATANQLEKDLDSFHTLYGQSLLVGPGLGKLASFGPTSNQLNQLSTSMQTGVASQLFGNKITNYKEQLAKDLKLNPSMPQAAEAGAYERLKAGAQRVQEYDNFVGQAQQMGINDPNQIKRLWNHYNIDMPIFDSKSLKVMNDNLNRGQDYINSVAGGTRLVNKGSQQPSASPSGSWPSGKDPVNSIALQGQMPPQGTVWMVRPDGKQVPVHEENVSMAKQKYKFRGIND